MKVDNNFVLREVAGDYIIIPVGKAVLEFNGLITVNEVGASIWKLLQEEITFEGLVEGILNEYDVERKHCTGRYPGIFGFIRERSNSRKG